MTTEQENQTREQFKMVKVIYVLFLMALLFPVTGLVGVIMAHVSAGEAEDPTLSHFRFQYRTFWIGLLIGVIAAITSLVTIGFLIAAVLLLWWIVRCVRGLITANKGEKLEDAERWGF